MTTSDADRAAGAALPVSSTTSPSFPATAAAVSSTVLFSTGRIMATPAALYALARLEISPLALIKRHVSGDWGEVMGEDRDANWLAVEHGGRILSAYLVGPLPDAVAVWVLTESDRSATTILMPSDY